MLAFRVSCCFQHSKAWCLPLNSSKEYINNRAITKIQEDIIRLESTYYCQPSQSHVRDKTFKNNLLVWWPKRTLAIGMTTCPLSRSAKCKSQMINTLHLKKNFLLRSAQILFFSWYNTVWHCTSLFLCFYKAQQVLLTTKLAMNQKTHSRKTLLLTLTRALSIRANQHNSIDLRESYTDLL